MIRRIARYAGIAFLKFVASLYVLFTIFAFVLPDWIEGTSLAIVTWIFVFIISYLFAVWAFHGIAPTRRDVVILFTTWMAVTILGYLAYSFTFTFRGPGIIAQPEILIQFAFELTAVVLAGYTTRRRRLIHETN